LYEKKKEKRKKMKMTKCARPAGKNVDASNIIHTSIIDLTKGLLIGTEVVLIAMFSSGCLIMDSRAGAPKSD